MPAAIRYGISYELFWKINPRIMRIYQSEYNRTVKERYEEINYSAWLSGQYIVSSIQKALDPKKVKYPEQPFGMADNEEEGENSEISAVKFSEYIDAFNKQFKSK